MYSDTFGAYFIDLKKYIFGWFTFNSCSISVPMAFRMASRKKNYYWPTVCITMFLLLEFGQIMIHLWRTVTQFLGLLPWGSLANLKKFKRKHSWQEIIFSKVNNNLLFCFFFLHVSIIIFKWVYLKWDIVLKVSWIHECMHKNTFPCHKGIQGLFLLTLCLSTLHLFSSKTSAKEERSSIRIV